MDFTLSVELCFTLFVIILLIVLYETKPAFKYYFKFGVYTCWLSVASAITIPICILRRSLFEPENLLLIAYICRIYSKIFGPKWEIRGKEHLSTDKSCIIVANHQSALDVLGMFHIWPILKKCIVVAKREILYSGPFGIALWISGIIFIERVKSDKAKTLLNNSVNKVKAKKIKLWIFPEGTRRNTGKLHQFKKGAFHMAIDAQLPIVPVVFSSYKSFLNDKEKFFSRGKVIAKALSPISTKGLTKHDVDDLINRTHEAMNKHFKQISEELNKSN